jgi:hypothetical protein
MTRDLREAFSTKLTISLVSKYVGLTRMEPSLPGVGNWHDAEVSDCAPHFRLFRYTRPNPSRA